MAEVEVTPCSWDDFVAQVKNMPETVWIFRGQASDRWRLESALERAPKTMTLDLAEAFLLTKFQESAHQHLTGQFLPTTWGEWLALMQHYGAPTRLLDFSVSPYVAAFFAAEELAPDGADGCAVWAIDRSWCIEASGKRAMERDPTIGPAAERRAESMREALRKGDLGYVSVPLAAGELLLEEVRSAGLRVDSGGVLPYEPLRFSDRMTIQQGVLLWCLDATKSTEENLHCLGDEKARIRKFVIRATERDRALRELRRMNITRASLFPGLEGYARSLRHLLVRESYESRRDRVWSDAMAVLDRRSQRLKGDKTEDVGVNVATTGEQQS